jgi:hypothetical protein
MKLLSSAFALSTFLVVAPCHAYTVDEWKAFRQKSGCASIPESNLESACTTRQEGVKGWCRSSGCKDTEGLVRSHRNLKDTLGRTSSSESAERERLQKEIDLKERAINEERQDLRNGVADFEKCVKARSDVQDIFRRAMELAKYDIDRDEKVKAAGDAQYLINYWKSEQLLHKEAEGNGEKALSLCKEYLNKLP